MRTEVKSIILIISASFFAGADNYYGRKFSLELSSTALTIGILTTIIKKNHKKNFLPVQKIIIPHFIITNKLSLNYLNLSH